MTRTRDTLTAVRAILVLTLLLGLAYPLAVTGVAQVAAPGRADGSLLRSDGRVVGSRLLGVAPTLRGGRPDPALFQPRPSATGYSTSASAFSNRGPNQDSARRFHREAAAAYLALNAATSPGLTVARIPIDAVTTSGSGVDPEISPANAAIQARRVAATRGLSTAAVTRLVAGHTHGRLLGLFGERGVNVPELNLALLRTTKAPR